MSFLNIYASILKLFSGFNHPFNSLISIVKCENDSLSDLKSSYMIFASKPPQYIKYKTIRCFLNAFSGSEVKLNTKMNLEVISLVNGNEPKIIEVWKKGLKAENFIPLYNREIVNAIVSSLKKDGDHVQIKIKVDEKMKEFIFWEFKVSGDCVEFSNCPFSISKECCLDYYPKEVYSIGYLLNYSYFWRVMIENSSNNSNAENITKKGFIKNSTIKTSSLPSLLYTSKEFKKPNEFKFTDFNLSIKQSEEFEEAELTLEKEVLIKPLTLFFESTKEIPEISFDMYFSIVDIKEGLTLSLKAAIEILDNGKVTRKLEENTFILMEIQEKENSLDVILGRPTGNPKNTIKAKNGVSIEFLNVLANNKSTKIALVAKETINGNFTFTTFTVKKEEETGKNSNLYEALTKSGLISITLNGDNGIIGTYGISAMSEVGYSCIYSDKLISIPFGAKSRFFSKKVIIFIFVVGMVIFGGIFAYFYIEKKEENVDTF